MLHYLAYGSNLHPERLRTRVPSAQLLGTVTLEGWLLRFDKRSWADDSGKCHLTYSPRHTAYGAVFGMDAADKPSLDRYEGVKRGYFDTEIDVRLGAKTCRCFTYLAELDFIVAQLRPFDWYRRIVLAGARFHGFPESYCRLIADTEALADPDEERAREHHAIADRCEAQ